MFQNQLGGKDEQRRHYNLENRTNLLKDAEEDLQRHHYTMLFLRCSWPLPLNQEHLQERERAQNYC